LVEETITGLPLGAGWLAETEVVLELVMEIGVRVCTIVPVVAVTGPVARILEGTFAIAIRVFVAVSKSLN
jgi:hypothetical protein